MRKITREICQAFLDGKPKKIGNTETDGLVLWLYGNAIAWHSRDTIDPGITFTMAGWPAAITRDRLNGLLDMWGFSSAFRFSVRKGVSFFGKHRIRSDQQIALWI